MKRHRILLAATAALIVVLGAGGAAYAHGITQQAAKPTIILVSGADEDASSWSGVAGRLQHDGYPVIVPGIALRSVAADAAYVSSIVSTVDGPVVLAGHSYGGLVISQVAAAQTTKVKALVYAAALIPVAGESLNGLVSKFPGSLFGPATTFTRPYPGGTDVYVKPESYHAVFAADRSEAQAALSAAVQHPVAAAATTEPVAATAPHGIPSYAIVAKRDMAIPPATERFMAKRAGAHTTEIASSHDVPVSHPGAVSAVIEKAAQRIGQ
jgi:pimeloyl-ACP methyl ester carboxylesterase